MIILSSIISFVPTPPHMTPQPFDSLPLHRPDNVGIAPDVEEESHVRLSIPCVLMACSCLFELCPHRAKFFAYSLKLVFIILCDAFKSFHYLLYHYRYHIIYVTVDQVSISVIIIILSHDRAYSSGYEISHVDTSKIWLRAQKQQQVFNLDWCWPSTKSPSLAGGRFHANSKSFRWNWRAATSTESEWC